MGSDGEFHICTKMKFSIKDFFSKCDQIRSFLRIRSYLLKKSLMENYIFCAVSAPPPFDWKFNSTWFDSKLLIWSNTSILFSEKIL